MTTFRFEFPGGRILDIERIHEKTPKGNTCRYMSVGKQMRVSFAEMAELTAGLLEDFCKHVVAASNRDPSGDLRPMAGSYGLRQLWAPAEALSAVLGHAILKAKLIQFVRDRTPPWGMFSPWPRGYDIPMEKVFAAADTNPSVLRERAAPFDDSKPPPCDHPATPADHRLHGLVWSLIHSPIHDGLVGAGELERLKAMAMELREIFPRPTPVPSAVDPSGAVECLLLGAMTTRPTRGEELAKRAGVRFNSHAKAALASLVKQGKCRLKRGAGGGYYVDSTFGAKSGPGQD